MTDYLLKKPLQLWTLLQLVRERFRSDRIAQVAGSLTFTTVLSMVPMLAVILALFTAFPVFNSFRSHIQDLLTQNLMPDAVSTQVMKYLNQFAAKAKGLTTWGLVGVMVTAIITMLTVDRALNDLWHVKKPRPLRQRVLVYWAALSLGPLLIGGSLSLTSYIASKSGSLVALMPELFNELLSLIPLALTTIAYAMLYTYVPNCKVERKHAIFGGAIAALLFEIMKRVFALYIKKFPTYTAVYGAFAAVPIFLLWVYMSWMVTLLGAAITAALPQATGGTPRRRTRKEPTHFFNFSLRGKRHRKRTRLR